MEVVLCIYVQYGTVARYPCRHCCLALSLGTVALLSLWPVRLSNLGYMAAVVLCIHWEKVSVAGLKGKKGYGDDMLALLSVLFFFSFCCSLVHLPPVRLSDSDPGDSIAWCISLIFSLPHIRQ